MLTDEEFEALANELGIPAEGREILSRIRSGDPDRRVASSRIAG